MRTTFATAGVVAMFMMVGCATAPRTQAEKRGLVAEADATVASMTAKDPSLQRLLDRSPGYAVFPNIGAAGAVVGGAYGRGVLFEQGRPAGFVELNQAAVGALIGGQTYAEILVFENEAAMSRLKAGNFDVGAEASAVALKAGIADAARFEGGVAIFQMPKGGLMATAAVTGQKINFQASEQFGGRRSERQGDAVTAGSRTTDSAYTVDRNLESDAQLRLRTERVEDSAERASDNARSATEQTEQRIEQRLQERSGESSPE